MERLASCAAHVKRVVLVMVLAHEGTGDVREGERAVWAYPPCHACLAARVAVTMAPKVTDMAPNVTDRPAIQGLLALCLCLVRWRDEQVRLGRRPDENRRESFGCVYIVTLCCDLCVERLPNGNVNPACLTSDLTQVPMF